MKKIDNKLINYSLKILTTLTFGLIFIPFNTVVAYGTIIDGAIYYYYPGSTGSYPNYYNNYYNNSAPYQPPIYTPATDVAPIIYSNSANPNITSATVVPPKTVAKAKTVKSSAPALAYLAVPAGSKIVNKLPAGATALDLDTINGLTANALYGTNSFLPSGLIQWIIFAIFILLLIILIRTLAGSREKYMATPLKHD